MVCVIMLMVFHSCYLVVILVAANFEIAGGVVVGLIWIGFAFARHRLLAEAEALYAEVQAKTASVAHSEGVPEYTPDSTLLDRLLEDDSDDGGYEEVQPPRQSVAETIT
eukprot:m.418770 g.418770  ORF g.418770 m.418770 type:complete len:109 (+) comp16835_c0_seq18:3309-3635(+)